MSDLTPSHKLHGSYTVAPHKVHHHIHSGFCSRLTCARTLTRPHPLTLPSTSAQTQFGLPRPCCTCPWQQPWSQSAVRAQPSVPARRLPARRRSLRRKSKLRPSCSGCGTGTSPYMSCACRSKSGRRVRAACCVMPRPGARACPGPPMACSRGEDWNKPAQHTWALEAMLV